MIIFRKNKKCESFDDVSTVDIMQYFTAEKKMLVTDGAALFFSEDETVVIGMKKGIVKSLDINTFNANSIPALL